MATTYVRGRTSPDVSAGASWAANGIKHTYQYHHLFLTCEAVHTTFVVYMLWHVTKTERWHKVHHSK